MRHRLVTLLAPLYLLLACSPIEPQPAPLSPSGDMPSRVHWQAGSCRDNVEALPAATALDADISVLSWNVAKGRRDGWESDLRRLADGRDLVLLQEAVLIPAFDRALADAESDFSPGYRNSSYVSGIWTAAGASALSFCSLQSREPWLATPKMALVTEYALLDRADTLMVANIHAVNFALGLGDFRQQLQQVAAILREHRGPLLFAGDFNTWSRFRQALLMQVVGELSLESARYDSDHRRQAFGFPLDHLFYRGMELVVSGSEPVATSDHNPIVATLRLLPDASALP